MIEWLNSKLFPRTRKTSADLAEEVAAQAVDMLRRLESENEILRYTVQYLDAELRYERSRR